MRGELGDGDVHAVEGRVDGTWWVARAEKGAAETWFCGGGDDCGLDGFGGLGHLGP